MANIQSQIKRNRQNERRRQRNKGVRSELKTRARKALEAADASQAEEALTALREAQRRIDVAAAKGVLHQNTAARRKSRLTKRVNELLSG